MTNTISPPQNHRYQDGGHLYDLVERMDKVWTQQVIEVHQILPGIVQAETLDNTRNLLYAQITKADQVNVSRNLKY